MTDDEYEQDILRNLEKHGWFCTCVFDPDGEEVSFAYSVGFTKTLNSSEFYRFWPGVELMHSMLWSVHSTNIVPEFLNSAMWYWGDPIERGGPLPAFNLSGRV